MHNRFWVITLLTGFIWLVGCTSAAEPVEVTRLVNQEVPVTVEITRVMLQEVTQEVTREVPVEVTRVVTVVVTPEPEVNATATTALTPTTAPPIEANSYTVQTGDTLALIAAQTGTDAVAIQSANNLADPNQITAGQVLIIPGWDGDLNTLDAVPTAEASAPPPPEAVVQGENLLPNPSYEGDWYFYLFNELQIPDGWQLTTDEGPNTLEQGAGGNFLRPEVRVISTADLPPAEHPLFIFNGIKTVKAFKGGGPTSFSLYTDVALPPGSYRLQLNFFPDTVAGYDSGQKIFASNPLAAEARIIFNDVGSWQGTQSGQRNTLTYDFTLDTAQTVRVGGAFRNRFIMNNNGWYLDDWSLYALTTP